MTWRSVGDDFGSWRICGCTAILAQEALEGARPRLSRATTAIGREYEDLAVEPYTGSVPGRWTTGATRKEWQAISYMD